MPKVGSITEFYDGQNQFKVPFMMYADFKVILKPIQGSRSGLHKSLQDLQVEHSPNSSKPYNKKVSQHIPSGWCVYSKFAYGKVDDPLKLYRGEDCIEKFCDYIKEEVHRLYHMFPEKPMDPLTNKQWARYKKLNKSHISYKPFNSKDPKVRDHCHYTGKYK